MNTDEELNPERAMCAHLSHIPLHASQVCPEVDEGQDDAHAVGRRLREDEVHALQRLLVEDPNLGQQSSSKISRVVCANLAFWFLMAESRGDAVLQAAAGLLQVVKAQLTVD